ncbi:hypothetical protein F5883DRAFT_655730 [Diaporthe sp. PMI_573]|nr:hypothetical protein F5883DRAFT_655730 [Diaporthaceae sp. PMI_573]
MGFKQKALWGGYTLIIIVVVLFSTASFGFNLYAIVEARKWLGDFVRLSGHGSNNWNWAVAILFFASSGLLGNSVVIGCSYKLRGPGCWRNVISGLECASILHLVITAPAWDAVHRYRWAELLREAGHADHAYHVDIFYKLGETVIIFWSVIGFICLVVVLCHLVSEHCLKRSTDSLCEESEQTKKHRSQSQANPDVEKGDNPKKDGRLRNEPGPLNHHPIFTEEDMPSTDNTANRDLMRYVQNENKAVLCGQNYFDSVSDLSSADSIFVKDYEEVDIGFYTTLTPPPFVKRT